ncbi:voltage-dependent T-type calcium channel subunit alpha-1H-like isoform X3 [Rhineura floridana]|uniref:voltage-dependent T-type calcium channel subunit alpha-1H-like isoform X3 n=1 Tax=Rhineura floridana TaxID=261503 RepID=UPI002AC83CE4|nr:voltage-dependent T-type calcium channel subunit alpha-1H-like isoform X3 [Rhineura floridana]
MTDGERREPFQPLTSDEVQVPIASGTATSQGPQPGEEKDEDALSACKSIQDSLASAGSSTRDPAHEGENQVPYPALASTVFFCLHQTTRPRSWCLKLEEIPLPKRSAMMGT